MTTNQSDLFIAAFNAMAAAAHETARAKGFWRQRTNIETACAAFGLESAARKMIDSQLRELIVSELAEACEGDRKDLRDDKIPEFSMVEAELADAIIRIGDYAEARGLRVAEALVAKMRFNEGREQMHGGKQF